MRTTRTGNGSVTRSRRRLYRARRSASLAYSRGRASGPSTPDNFSSRTRVPFTDVLRAARQYAARVVGMNNEPAAVLDTSPAARLRDVLRADVEATTHANFRLYSTGRFWLRAVGKLALAPNVRA